MEDTLLLWELSIGIARDVTSFEWPDILDSDMRYGWRLRWRYLHFDIPHDYDRER